MEYETPSSSGEACTPRIWPVIVCFISTWILSGLLISLLVFSTFPDTSDDPNDAFKWAESTPWVSRTCVLISDAVFLLIAVVAGLFSGVPFRKRLQLRWPRISAWELLLFCAGAVAFGIIPLAKLGFGIDHLSEKEMHDSNLFQDLYGAQFVFVVVLVGLVTAIGEELFFRGYIQTRFCERWGTKWGILWTSLLFGLIHWDPSTILWAACGGAYQGILTQRTKSVLPAIASHSALDILLALPSVEDFRQLQAWNVTLVGVSLLIIFASLRRALCMAGRER